MTARPRIVSKSQGCEIHLLGENYGEVVCGARGETYIEHRGETIYLCEPHLEEVREYVEWLSGIALTRGNRSN